MTVTDALIQVHALHQPSKLGYCRECGFRSPCNTAKAVAPVIRR